MSEKSKKNVSGLVRAAFDQVEQEKADATTAEVEAASLGIHRSRQIGPYKLLQKIGEGGMGSVWMAEQVEPVKRRVAIKLIKGGQDDQQILARFEAERQALALMDHPHIAKVLDAATSEDGAPYFVMELVQGDPVTEYCDINRLKPADRMELFIQACQAVQHAHHKGIVHRDVKPSNILVHVQDGKPTVKVIDFGLAKALEHQSRLTDKTLFTEFGKVLGTVQYMSPEQARLDAIDIDTRTDVYSLGVVLYELLAGSTPIEKETLKEHALLKVLELIRERDPPRPSNRLSESIDKQASIASQRQIQPAKLQQILRGELDWIIMRALEKDRTRRYPTPNDFAEDVQRYLQGDAVVACPPSAAYRLRKFVRKHRTPLAIATGTFLIVAAALLGIARYADRAQAARVEAEGFANRSEMLLTTLLNAFRSVNPHQDMTASGMLAKDVLIKTRASILSGPLADYDKMLCLVQITESLSGLGEYEAALQTAQHSHRLAVRLYGADDPYTLFVQNAVALTHLDAGNTKEAIDLWEPAIKLQQIHLGPNHPDTLVSTSNLAAAYLDAWRTDEAIQLYEHLVPLQQEFMGRDHPETLSSMIGLGKAFRITGKLGEGIELLEQTRELAISTWGAEHPNTLQAMIDLAACYQELGRTSDAIKLHQQVHELRQMKLGEDHPDTLLSLLHIAIGHHRDGQLEEAVRQYKNVLSRMEATLGIDHPYALDVRERSK